MSCTLAFLSRNSAGQLLSQCGEACCLFLLHCQLPQQALALSHEACEVHLLVLGALGATVIPVGMPLAVTVHAQHEHAATCGPLERSTTSGPGLRGVNLRAGQAEAASASRPLK